MVFIRSVISVVGDGFLDIVWRDLRLGLVVFVCWFVGIVVFVVGVGLVGLWICVVWWFNIGISLVDVWERYLVWNEVKWIGRLFWFIVVDGCVVGGEWLLDRMWRIVGMVFFFVVNMFFWCFYWKSRIFFLLCIGWIGLFNVGVMVIIIVNFCCG